MLYLQQSTFHHLNYIIHSFAFLCYMSPLELCQYLYIALSQVGSSLKTGILPILFTILSLALGKILAHRIMNKMWTLKSDCLSSNSIRYPEVALSLLLCPDLVMWSMAKLKGKWRSEVFIQGGHLFKILLLKAKGRVDMGGLLLVWPSPEPFRTQISMHSHLPIHLPGVSGKFYELETTKGLCWAVRLLPSL